MLNFKELKDVDLKLYLLSGGSIRVENLIVEPYKLHEIRDYGYTKYMENLQWMSLSIDDFIDSIKDEGKKKVLIEQRANLKTFDFYISIGGKEFLDVLMTALAMVFKTDDVRILDDNVIVLNFKKQGIVIEDEKGRVSINPDKLEVLREEEILAIHRDNFDDVIEVVKFQNYLTKVATKKDEGNPVDEETRALMEHMEKMRQKVEAKKKRQREMESEDDGDIDISDIISAVSSKSNSINKLNIWELTLYQLYDEYARLELVDNYEFSIKAMMAGAKDVKLKHWSSKIL